MHANGDEQIARDRINRQERTLASIVPLIGRRDFFTEQTFVVKLDIGHEVPHVECQSIPVISRIHGQLCLRIAMGRKRMCR